MKKLLFILLIQVFVANLFAHEGGHGVPNKIWELKNSNKELQANFIKVEDGVFYLNDNHHQLLQFNITDFSEKDQQHILSKSEWIQTTNGSTAEYALFSFFKYKNGLVLFGILLILFAVLMFVKRNQYVHLAYGILGVALLFVACENTNSTEGTSEALSTKVPANDLAVLESIFGAFDGVTTRHDDQYFYIESNGIPNHEMMTGITNWQQQVPIPHDYTDNNSWAIPIQPQLSDNPLSTKENFMKGAIAIAVNGIPIFNPLNNRGEDANTIGELDNWGGHCGRADDYHYHLPPTHLQGQVGTGKPIAYALDGFPVYGETTQQLDEYLGRFNADSSYQYHAVKEYPYLIAGMRGKVAINPRTSAPENEIMPQAKTKGVRPALRPLRGAAITDFETIAPNQYALTYILDKQTYVINYSWDENGWYNFEFVNPDGTREQMSYER